MMAASVRPAARPQRIWYWAWGPNRHLDPLLEGIRDCGVDVREYYGSRTLRWRQLGTPPPDSPYRTFIEPTPRMVRQCLESDTEGTAVHLVHGAIGLSALAVREVVRKGRPYFVITESCVRRSKWSPKALVRNAIYRRHFREARRVFAVSRFAAEAFHEVGVEREKIVPMVYPGPAGTSAWESSGVSQQRRVLYCGRAIPGKGLDLLTLAVTVLKRSGQAIAFEVAGDGPLKANLLSRLGAEGVYVVDHGVLSTPAVLELMREVDVVVLPSLYFEGWGYVVTEAMASGTAVVVSDIVGATEIVIPGVNGYVFRSGDLESLVGALRASFHINLAAGVHKRELSALRVASEPAAVAEYVVAVMTAALTDQPVPGPPWLEAIHALGGNRAFDFWAAWNAGQDLPTYVRRPMHQLPPPGAES